jgi:putative ABC transport system substrate-binding protein
VKRREFITLLDGAAAAWPLAASGQQSAMPVSGFLHSVPPQRPCILCNRVPQWFEETGFVKGQNVAVEYRRPEGHNERRRPAVRILTSPTGSHFAAAAR